MEAAGKKWLKITSVIMLIIGAAGIVFSVAGMIGYSQMDTQMAADMASIGFDIRQHTIQLGVEAAVYVLEVAVAVVGLVLMNRPERGRVCLIVGILLIGIQLVQTIGVMVVFGFSLLTLLGFAASAVIAAFYCAGAVKNLHVASGDALKTEE